MAQGLNFQTHQFVDPTEGLQKALGAGSMFAKSLKSMQDFESDQARLRMMQAEKDRQAKIDFANEQEKAKNLMAAQALNQKAVKDDFGNTMYQALADQSKNAMVAKSDAELGFKGRSYADMFSGLDTSKWNQEQLAERDKLLAADVDKNAQYTAGNKLEVQKRLNMLSGMSNEDAEKSAAEMLGLKADVAKSLLSGAEQQKQFGSRVEETMNSPLFMQSDSQALEAIRNKYGSTAQIESSIRAANEAESLAREKKHDQIEQKKALRDQAQTNAEKDQLNKEMQILQFQMQNIGSPLERESYKESSGGGSKKVYDEDMSAVQARLLKEYSGTKDPALKQNIVDTINQAKQRGLLPNAVEGEIRAHLVPVGDKEDGQAQQFKLDSTLISNMTADRDAFERLYGGATSSSEASMYAKAIQDKQAITDKMAGLIGKKGKGVELEIANLQRQLSELERTPMQSARDAAYQAGLDFAKDYNIGDYGTKKAEQDKVTQALLGPSGVSTASGPNRQGGDSLQPKLYGGEIDSEIKGRTAKQTKLSQFQLPAGFNNLDKKQQDNTIQDLTISVIDQEEGTKKDPYKPYKDSLGKTTVGTGVLVSGFNDYLGHKYDPRSNADREALDIYQVKVKKDALNAGYKQAAELGFSADAIPILASVNYQLGAGWNKEFKQTYALLKKGDYDKAIGNIKDSDWYKQTPNRADAFIAAIEQQKRFKQSGMLNGVQQFYNGANANAQTNPASLQQSLMDTSKKQAVYSNKTPIDFMSTQEQSIYNDPNSRWIDKHNAFSAAEDRLNDYQSGIANRQRSLELSSKRQASTPEAKLQSMLSVTGYQTAYNKSTPSEKLRIHAEALRKYEEINNAAALQNLVNNRY